MQANKVTLSESWTSVIFHLYVRLLSVLLQLVAHKIWGTSLLICGSSRLERTCWQYLLRGRSCQVSETAKVTSFYCCY